MAMQSKRTKTDLERRIDDAIRMTAPGTALRHALDMIIAGHMGALICVGDEDGVIKAGNDGFPLNISFTANPGETVAIVGGTGAGKSSLVNLIPRFYDATEGEILVDGVDVRDYRIEDLRDGIGMVLQNNVLFTGTLRENILWGKADATDDEIIEALKNAQAWDFVTEMPQGLDTFIQQGGTNVSGGQKQRLCIARALLKKPKILILDDSTSAVDTKTDSLIRKAFLEEIPDTTKIIIAQRISSVQDADRIIVMDGGSIDAVGTHDELLKDNKIYQEVYYSQQKGSDDNG